MKSKTLISRQMKGKLNPELVETIIEAKKNKNWLNIASLLSKPRSQKISVNLDEIEKESKEGDTIAVPGKVLSSGSISKKIKIAALSFSQEAKRKLKENKCGIASLIEEIEKNKDAKGVKILV